MSEYTVNLLLLPNELYDKISEIYAPHMNLIDIRPKQFVDMLVHKGIIKLSNSFKEGDIICAKKNTDQLFPLFFTANDTDVEDYSGINREYYIMIK